MDRKVSAGRTVLQVMNLSQKKKMVEKKLYTYMTNIIHRHILFQGGYGF